MRKALFIIIVVIFFLFILNNNSQKEEIRVRIIPNSNSADDINIKNEVKEVVKAYLVSTYDDDYEKCCNNIKSSINRLEEVLISMFGEIRASLDYHTLYNKTYNDNAIRNEECLCLYIIIGNGDGDNWWGTIYPDLLGIESDEEIKYESLFLKLF